MMCSCGIPLPVILGPRLPKAGDPIICGECGTISVFIGSGNFLGVRETTDEEFEKIIQHDAVRRLYLMVQHDIDHKQGVYE